MSRRVLMEEIRYRTSHKPWLFLLETSVYYIPERVSEYGDDLFVFYNSVKGRYEIHSAENKGDTFSIPVYLDQLDCRVLEMVRQMDLRNRGKDIFREIDEHNDRLERREWKRRQQEVYDTAKDVRSQFAKLAWEM